MKVPVFSSIKIKGGSNQFRCIHPTLLTCCSSQVIREHIARHGGYEINTEGDSFHIAFSSVAQAVFFAMDTQYRLLETNWPKEVLKLPDCGVVYDKDGLLLMKGPRVRMGIHYAAEGTVAQRYAMHYLVQLAC